MKILLVNGNISEIKGGTESFYTKLSNVIGSSARCISLNTAIGSLLPGYDFQKKESLGSYAIDRYLKYYETVNDVDLIIKEAGVGGFYDLKTPQIATFGNPYHSIFLNFKMNGLLDFSTLLDRYVFTHLQRNCGNQAKVNIALSKFMVEDMKSIGVTNNVRIIENAVDINKFKPMNKDKLREKYEIPNDKKVAVWVGSYSPVKGFHIIRNITRYMQDIYWILVFKFKSEIEDHTPRLSNVKLFYELDEEQMAEIYNCADFFILPSICEGCSHAIIEALSCDIPIVATNTGMLWERRTQFFRDKSHNIESYGIKVNYWNSSAFIEGIKSLDGNSFSPRKYILKRKLDIDTWGKKWKNLIKEVLDGVQTASIKV